MTQPSTAEQDAFYRGLWERPKWSGPEPNANELNRWRAIDRLLSIAAERSLLPASDAAILDLGCGRGWLTHLLASRGQVLGIDPLEASIEMARRNFPELDFRRASASDLLAEGQASRFDLVVSSEVIEHVPDASKPAFLAATFRLLRPGGCLLLTTPRGELWKRWSRRGVGHQPIEDWISEPALTAAVEHAGFELIRRTRAHLPRHPLTWEGHLLKWVLLRKGIRRIPLLGLRTLLGYRASQYQVMLARKTREEVA